MDNFWMTLTTAAATLTGFTLAGYTIYITRAEMAASDPICRQYNFKEYASSYSLFFVLFALLMFIAPFVLGLLELAPSYTVEPKLLLACGLIIVVVALCSIFMQARYLYFVTKYNRRLIAQKKRRRIAQGMNPPVRERIKPVVVYVSVLILVAITALSLLILSQNIVEALLKLNLPDKWVESFTPVRHLVPKTSCALLSLIAGLTLICFYLYVFQPERFLFKRVGTTEHDPLTVVKRRVRELKDKKGSLVATAKSVGSLINTVKPELKERGTYVERMIGSMERQVGKLKELEGKADNHLGYLEIISDEFVTYDGIIWIMNGANMYIEGINRFEDRLKDIPGQLTLLKELLNVKADMVTETRNSFISIAVNRNHDKNRSMFRRIISGLLGA